MNASKTVTADSNAISYQLWHQMVEGDEVMRDTKGEPVYIALTKPDTHGNTCGAYYARVQEGADAKMMRICPTGQRPDSLGRR